jgi:hypothetical protein
MGVSYRSPSAGTSLFYLLLFPAIVACGEPSAVTTEFFVRPHLIPSCKPEDGSTVTLAALGPFSPSNQTVENLPLYGSTRELRFPADTSAVEAVATDGARRFLGYTERKREGGFELTLLPERRECVLFSAQEGFPRETDAKAFGFSAAAGVLFAAGGRYEAELSQGALAFDLDRAIVRQIPDPEAELCATCGLHSSRVHATVTEFGTRLLVAGGEPPNDDESDPGDSAEVYDPELAQFEPETIELRRARTRHTAIVLRSGETLLVGGRNETGLPQLLEVVSPESRRSASLGLAPLVTGREHPQVVRLSDDRIFVGGGVDVSGAPVASAQWFTADAGEAIGETEDDWELPLPPRHDWSFVALPGGGVLGVAGCDPALAPEDTCEADDGDCCLARCGPERGCPSDTAIWFTRDRTATEFRAPATFSAPLLAPGSDGSPWLVDAGLPTAPVYRFDPWRAEFQRTTATLSAPPGRSRQATGSDGFGPQPALVSLGPDTFAWLSADTPPSLMVFRGGTRGPLSNDLPLVVLTHPDDPARPAHLAPDRATGDDLFVRNQESMQNELWLAAGDGAARVWLTDARFGDATVRIDFEDAPPRLLVDALEVGSAACQWPRPDESSGSVSITRRGTALHLAQGRAVARCDGPDGAVSLGLRAGARPSRVSRFEVVRD